MILREPFRFKQLLICRNALNELAINVPYVGVIIKVKPGLGLALRIDGYGIYAALWCILGISIEICFPAAWRPKL